MDYYLFLFLLVIALWVYRIFLQLRYRKARHYLEANEFIQAKDLYIQTLKYPQRFLRGFRTVGHLGLASAYSYLGKIDLALAEYNHLIAMPAVYRPIIYIGRGNIYVYLRRFDEAIADFRLAMKSKLKYQLLARLGIVRCYTTMKQYEIVYAETEILLNEIHTKGDEYRNKKIPLKEIACKTYLIQASALARLNRQDEALEIYPLLIEHYDAYLDEIYHARAMVYVVFGEYNLALADFELLLALPSKPEEYFIGGYSYRIRLIADYAVILFACGKIDEAQAQWRELQTQAPALTSAERMGQEFFWTDEMIAKAKELEATLA